jgi:hypothetical protein
MIKAKGLKQNKLKNPLRHGYVTGKMHYPRLDG